VQRSDGRASCSRRVHGRIYARNRRWRRFTPSFGFRPSSWPGIGGAVGYGDKSQFRSGPSKSDDGSSRAMSVESQHAARSNSRRQTRASGRWPLRRVSASQGWLGRALVGAVQVGVAHECIAAQFPWPAARRGGSRPGMTCLADLVETVGAVEQHGHVGPAARGRTLAGKQRHAPLRRRSWSRRRKKHAGPGRCRDIRPARSRCGSM